MLVKRGTIDKPPCTKLTTKKYTERPSPPYSANKCTKDCVTLGNDGKMYKIVVNSKGIHNWSKVKPTQKVTKSKNAKIIKRTPINTPPCIKLTKKKYTQRKTPPYPANNCTSETVTTGNDGKTYKISVNSKGIHKWVKVSSKQTNELEVKKIFDSIVNEKEEYTVEQFIERLYKLKYPDFRFEPFTVNLAKKFVKNHVHDTVLYFGQVWNFVYEKKIDYKTFTEWMDKQKKGLTDVFMGIKVGPENRWMLYYENYQTCAYPCDMRRHGGLNNTFVTGSGADQIWVGWSPRVHDKKPRFTIDDIDYDEF